MCNVTFWKDKDFSGRYKNYSSPTNVKDTNDIHWHDHDSDDMKDDISSIQTDGSAWVRIFSSTDYGGRTALIEPNSNVNLEDVYAGGDDMNDTIQSFQIYDHKPIDTSNVINNFVDLYPSGTVYRNNDYKYYIDMYSQDSEYWVYYPLMTITGDTIAFSVNLSHRQAEKDDQAVLTFSMDMEGNFVDSIKVEYTIQDATQVPDWMITMIDDAIEVGAAGAMALADGAEIVLTDGVGVVATIETDELIEDIADVLTFCVDHLNAVLSAIFKLQDDGGTMNFAAVVSQCISRTVLAYYQELFGPDQNTIYTMNSDQLIGGLQSNSNLTNVSDSWDNSKHTPFATFSLSSASDDDYRAYLPDASFFYAQGGSMLTCKIDYMDSFSKDDHLILQTVFDPKGNLFAVMGSIDLYGGSSSEDYKAPSSGVLAYNDQRQMMHITKDDDGNDVISVLSGYQTLEDAYGQMLSDSLTDTGTNFDITIETQQYNLVNASIEVIAAMQASLVM
jgi:hypothetical protein